jgi:hypothetical protein
VTVGLEPPPPVLRMSTRTVCNDPPVWRPQVEAWRLTRRSVFVVALVAVSHAPTLFSRSASCRLATTAPERLEEARIATGFPLGKKVAGDPGEP